MAYEDLLTNGYKQIDEDETENRGVLDRVLSPLSNTSVTSALYNLTDDDPNTTVLGGIGAGLARQFNPFRNDVSGSHEFGDVLENVFGTPDNVVEKIATGVGGFVGDILLDPTTYITGGLSAVGKIAKGSEKSLNAIKIADEVKDGIKVVDSAIPTMEDCIKTIQKQYPKINPNDIDMVVKAEAEQLRDTFANKVMRHKTDEQIRESKGITIGLANLPFSSKFNTSLKQSAIFEKELIKGETLAKIGDQTIAPHFNKLASTVRQTKMAQALSDNNKMFVDTFESLDNTLSRFLANSKIGKNAEKFSNISSTAFKAASEFDSLSDEEKEVFTKLVNSGEFDNYEAFYNYKIDVLKKIQKEGEKVYGPETLEKVNADKAKYEEQLKVARRIQKEILDRKKKSFSTGDFEPIINDRHGADTIQKIEKDIDTTNITGENLKNIFGTNAESYVPIDEDKSLDEFITALKKDPEIPKKDIIDIATPQDEAKLGGIFEEIERLNGRIGELYSTGTDEALDEAQKLEKEIDKLYNSKEFNTALDRQAGVVKSAKDEGLTTTNLTYTDKDGNEVSYLENLSDQPLLGNTKSSRQDMDLYEARRIAEEQGEVVTSNIDENNAWIGMGKEVSPEEGDRVRTQLRELLGTNEITEGKYDKVTGRYLESKIDLVDRAFDNNTIYGIQSLLSQGRTAQAIDLANTAMHSVTFGSSFNLTNKRVAGSVFGKQLAGMASNGIEKLNQVTPTFLRMDSKDINLFSEGAETGTTISHTRPVYPNSWTETFDSMKGPDGKIDLDRMAENGKTHRENLKQMSIDMTKKVSDKKPTAASFLGDNAIGDLYLSADEHFIENNMEYLKELDAMNDEFHKKNTNLMKGKSYQPDPTTQRHLDELNSGNYKIKEKKTPTPKTSKKSNKKANIDDIKRQKKEEGIRKRFTNEYENKKADIENVVEKYFKSPLQTSMDGYLSAKKRRLPKEWKDYSFDEQAIYMAKRDKNVKKNYRDYLLGKERADSELLKAETEMNDNLDRAFKNLDIEADYVYDNVEKETNNISRMAKDENKIQNKDYTYTNHTNREKVQYEYEGYRPVLADKYGDNVANWIESNFDDIKKDIKNYDQTLDTKVKELEDELKDKNTTPRRMNKIMGELNDIRNEQMAVRGATRAQDLSNTQYINKLLTLAENTSSENAFGLFGKYTEMANPKIKGMTYNERLQYFMDQNGFKVVPYGPYTEDVTGFKKIQLAPGGLNNEYVAQLHGIEYGETIAKEGSEELKQFRQILKDKGYSSNNATTYLDDISIEDKNKIINTITQTERTKFYETYANANPVQKTQMFKEATPEVQEFLQDMEYKDFVFGRTDLRWIDKETLATFEEKNNKVIESLKGMLDNKPINIMDSAEAEAYKHFGKQYKKYADIEEMLQQADGDESAKRIFTTMSGMRMSSAEMAEELNKIGMKDMARSKLEDIIPRRRSDEATAFLKELSEEDQKKLTEGLSKLSMEDANRVMELRSGGKVTKWYDDDISSVFIGSMLSTQKTINSSKGMNIILNTFANKFEGNIPKGETLIVKRGALRNFVKNSEIEDLEKFGITDDAFANMFIELDKEQYHKLQLAKPKYKDNKPVLNAFTMKQEDLMKFNDASELQTKMAQNAFLNIYDKFLGIYKTINTVPNPGFHINNAIGNMFNSFLYCGSAVCNPVKINTARTILKNPDPKQWIMIGDTKYSYKQINNMIKQTGMLEEGFFNNDIKNGVKKVKESWVDLPIIKQGLEVSSEIESVQRTTLFIEALRNGEDIQGALDVVNNFLFDYSKLTSEEQAIMKRAIPFYTFMRKNIPLQLTEMLSQPNTYRTLEKFFNNFERLSGEDYVPDINRNDWQEQYIQMPFKIKGRTWGIDPNLPYEQFDRMTPSKILAQSSPVIKAPIELATGRSLYTDFPLRGGVDRYLADQISHIRAYNTTMDKYENTPKEGDERPIDAGLYATGYLTGMPMSGINDYGVE